MAYQKRPVIAITFYSALLQSGKTEVIDALITALKKDYNCIPIHSKSFKDKKTETFTFPIKKYNPISVINLTGFSLREYHHPKPFLMMLVGLCFR
ncbi:MAG: hypothetical protein CM15mP73_0380 [Hyphomicrobiales bacterium]|nr:MAG: hypothetical protein CM15mP73_0380 [Hyphomicrobiales bacterium]